MLTTTQLSDYQCNDNVYYISNNLEDLDYRGDNIIIQPSPNEFNLRALLPGNLSLPPSLSLSLDDDQWPTEMLRNILATGNCVSKSVT